MCVIFELIKIKYLQFIQDKIGNTDLLHILIDTMNYYVEFCHLEDEINDGYDFNKYSIYDFGYIIEAYKYALINVLLYNILMYDDDGEDIFKNAKDPYLISLLRLVDYKPPIEVIKEPEFDKNSIIILDDKQYCLRKWIYTSGLEGVEYLQIFGPKTLFEKFRILCNYRKWGKKNFELTTEEIKKLLSLKVKDVELPFISDTPHEYENEQEESLFVLI